MNSSNCEEKSQLEANEKASSEMNNLTSAAEASNKVRENMSTLQVSLIENMASFLEAKGDAKIDSKLLRSMAEAWSNSITGASPGSLQDVTMDNSYFSYRSPPCVAAPQFQGSVSPQGRSVREYDEQMQALRKENFNLRLRMYFIEETLPNLQQQQTSEGHEAIVKELIDTKVEMEMLRREVQEKQEILKDAAQAINQMEQIQKETEIKSQTVIEELKERIQCLELENDMERANAKDLFENTSDNKGSDLLQQVQELEAALKSSQDKLREYEHQVIENTELIKKRDITIKEYEEKVKEMVFQNAELLESLENKDAQLDYAEVQKLREELQAHKRELADKTCTLLEVEEKLKKREQNYENACLTIQKLMLNAKKQQDEIIKLKECKNGGNDDIRISKNKSSSDIGNCRDQVEVSTLSRSLSDTETCKETNKNEKEKYEAIIKQQESIIESLKSEVKKKTINLQKLVNQELWEKNREIERLTKIITSDHVNPPTSPTNNDIANALSRSFSDSEFNSALERNNYLQRKLDVLIQSLGNQEHTAPIVSQLHAEISEVRAEAEAAERWRRECADVCTILSTRLEELAGFLNSLLKHKDVLGVLANNTDKCNAMRKAVDRSLDLSKSLNRTLSLSGYSIVDQSIAQLSNLSEILADFDNVDNKTFNSHEEFCGQQSIETLRAENKALKNELDKRRNAESKKERRSQPLQPLDMHSESEAWSEPDRKVSLARIGLEEHSASYKQADSDSDSDRKNQNRKTRAQERIVQLEQMIAHRDERILEIQCQLVEADNRLKKESLRVIELTNEADRLRGKTEESCKDIIEADAKNSGGHTHNYSMLMRDINEKTYQLEQLEREKNEIGQELQDALAHIKSLKSEIDCIKVKHEEALKLASDAEAAKLNQLKVQMEKVLYDKLEEQENKHQLALDREWIARAIYEDCTNQLIQLQKLYAESQRTIEILNEHEQELRLTMVENEHSARSLKKQLDESTLQASKAILERTRAYNDKLLFESQVKDLQQQLNNEKIEKNLLEQQCRKLQASKTTAIQNEPLKSRLSDISQSGYTSEEVLRSLPEPKHGDANVQLNATASVQRASNSSPDLGIESDAGRVSSAEMAQTIANTDMSIDNKENTNIQGEISDVRKTSKSQQEQAADIRNAVNHDCVKVEQENSELRRKLIRTKRAFEDTYQKLKLANQKKAQIEKDIKNQILKTHNVLKNVRSNMENEL